MINELNKLLKEHEAKTGQGQPNQSSQENNNAENEQQQNQPAAAAAQPEQPKISDADFLAMMKEKLGIEGESFDDIKSKFSTPKQEVATATTEEQKAAKEKERQVKVYQTFLDNGGTQEQYDSIRAILATDGLELSKKEVIKQLTDEGFTAEEAAELYKNRYYIAGEGEEDLFTETQRKFGQKALEKRAEKIKNNALEPLQKAEQLVAQQEQWNDQWGKWSTDVDEHFKSFKNEMEFSLKNDKGEEIAKLPFKMDSKEVKAIQDQLKNPKEVNELLYSKDNAKSAKTLTDLLMWAKIGQKLASKAYEAGATEMAKKVEETFPSKPLVRPITSDTAGADAKKKVSDEALKVAQNAFTPQRYRTANG